MTPVIIHTFQHLTQRRSEDKELDRSLVHLCVCEILLVSFRIFPKDLCGFTQSLHVIPGIK